MFDGNGSVNFMVVFIVGFAPDALGYVLIFSTAVAFGGTRLLMLN
jgi:hypothetical protein